MDNKKIYRLSDYSGYKEVLIKEILKDIEKAWESDSYIIIERINH